MSRTLLLDADLLAFVASAVTQRSYKWNGEDGETTIASDLDAAIEAAETEIQFLIDRLEPDELIVCLSDDFSSFRKDLIDKTYKGKRTADRPLQLYPLKDWMRETYDVAEIPTLEADDVMGIIATDPDRDDERIIVSADKDMRTIPAKVYHPQLQQTQGGGWRAEPLILDISKQDAWRFHYWQAIVGDQTDNYPGAFRIGAKSIYAEAVLEATDEEEAWEWVVAAHNKAGGDEDDAVRQARLARILRHQDFDGRRPILWLPPYSGERL